MSKKLYFGLLGVLIAVVLTNGCKPQASSQQNSSYGYFKTPFQSESQFIVEAIVSDLAEQMYYAAKHQLPEKKYFSVTATEKPGSPPDAPLYNLLISLDRQHAGLKLDLNVNGPIWSPDVYGDLATALATTLGLRPNAATETDDTSLLSDLLDGTAETIEQNNQTLSDALEKNFTDPQLHEQAALLLGAFTLREHSGHFFEIRSPLSRMTAHLAMARFLSPADSFGVNGKLAGAMLLTLVNDEAPALEVLKSIDSKDPAVASMIRALQARNTGDFRPLSKAAKRSPVESVAWFAAMADYVSAPIAWQKLDNNQKQNINFVRVAREMSYSVEMGNAMMQMSMALELQEIQDVYEYSHGKKLNQATLIEALNELPEHCFTIGPGKKIHVRIIGWGQWAMFLQRHLCYALQQNFYQMNSMLGVPDEAKKFGDQCDQQFSELRLYPFVRRFNCTNVDDYHKSVDDGFKVTVATPQLVPAQCWNYLCYKTYFAPLYDPNPNPHVNEWHNHNPPPGTVYDLNPRLYHPSLTGRPDVAARFEQLHELAPYDVRIANYIMRGKYKDHPTYEQAMGLLHDVLPWSVTALRKVAGTVLDQPDQCEKLLLQAAELDPSVYYDLADYAWREKQEDKAAQYSDKACDTDPDMVRASNHAEWRVRYYLKKGQTDKAREIADSAAQVYSSGGLVAEAVFMEATSNYDGAFEWYAKNEERYNYSGPLIDFCLRYKTLTGDTRFDEELKKREKILFPKGMEKVSLADFHTAPTDGVVFQTDSDLLAAAGMKKGDVIVAIKGIRVHNDPEFRYLRDAQEDPELDLIVWQGGAFNEVKSSPPNHRFGVSVSDYKPN